MSNTKALLTKNSASSAESNDLANERTHSTISTNNTKKRQRSDTKTTTNPESISAEEAKLEALLFGNETNKPSNTNKQQRYQDNRQADEDNNTNNATITKTTTTKTSAWHDDDDDNININISNKARLRKLRTDHNEHTITGTEYSQRLKQQFQKLTTTTNTTTATTTNNSLQDNIPTWAKGPSERKKASKSTTLLSQKSTYTNEDDNDENDNDNESEEEEEDLLDNVLRDTTSVVDRTNIHHQISPGTLSISRLRDANITDPCRAVVQASEFHPQLNTSILFTASLDNRLRFFSIDGKKNTRLASVYFPDLPIASASWTGDGSEVICTGRRSYFYTYDINAGKAIRIPRILGREEKSLESCIVSPSSSSSDATNMLAFLGNNGTIILCSNRTKQWIGNLKMEGNVRAACFTTSYNNEGGVGALEYPELLTVGTSGMVYRWDLRTLKCIYSHMDEGSIGNTSIAATYNGKQYAIGSNSGIVNIYNTHDIYNTINHNSNIVSNISISSILSSTTTTIKPLHTISNLTTSINNLRYNYDNTILAISSQAVKDSLKLVHTQSGTVFSNWPTDRTPLHYVTSMGFSRSNEYFQVGNDRGRVLLYRLNAYS